MKNIIIWGVPRSGKSTLAARICKELGHNLISVDALRESYKTLLLPAKMPKGNINRSAFIAPAITKFMEILDYTTKQFNQYFILEGVTLDMNYIATHLDMSRYITVCMSYPNISEEDKLNEILKYDNAFDWTHELEPEKKRELCKEYIGDSKIVQETANCLGLKFIDCSDRKNALEQAYKYIIENI